MCATPALSCRAGLEACTWARAGLPSSTTRLASCSLRRASCLPAPQRARARASDESLPSSPTKIGCCWRRRASCLPAPQKARARASVESLSSSTTRHASCSESWRMASCLSAPQCARARASDASIVGDRWATTWQLGRPCGHRYRWHRPRVCCSRDVASRPATSSSVLQQSHRISTGQLECVAFLLCVAFLMRVLICVAFLQERNTLCPWPMPLQVFFSITDLAKPVGMLCLRCNTTWAAALCFARSLRQVLLRVVEPSVLSFAHCARLCCFPARSLCCCPARIH